MSYADQLRHPLWQQKRLEVLQHFGWSCFRCGGTERALHAHHKQYIKGHAPWEYPLSNFESLCDRCHEMVHVQKAALDGILATFPTTEYHRLMRILETTKRLGDAAADPITRANIIQDEIDLELDYLRGAGGCLPTCTCAARRAEMTPNKWTDQTFWENGHLSDCPSVGLHGEILE